MSLRPTAAAALLMAMAMQGGATIGPAKREERAPDDAAERIAAAEAKRARRAAKRAATITREATK